MEVGNTLLRSSVVKSVPALRKVGYLFDTFVFFFLSLSPLFLFLQGDRP